MIEEWTLFLNLKLGKVLLPLCFEVLKDFKCDFLGSLFLQVFEASPALVEMCIVNLSSQDKVVCGSCFHALYLLKYISNIFLP